MRLRPSVLSYCTPTVSPYTAAMMSYLFVAFGGGLGASARFGLSQAMGRTSLSGLPLATLTANVMGGLLMGLLVGWLSAKANPELRLFLGIGVLGGFTTFSAFSLEAWTLLESGKTGLFILYIAASVVLSIAALAAGLMIARQVFS